jgi:hypothetical protein
MSFERRKVIKPPSKRTQNWKKKTAKVGEKEKRKEKKKKKKKKKRKKKKMKESRQ